MIFLLKKNIKRCLALGRGLALSFRPKTTAGKRVLMYHSIGDPSDHRLAIKVIAGSFEEQMGFLLSAGYKAVTLSEMIDGGFERPNEKLIAITFDDGYKDNVGIAAPIMKRLGLTATFLVTTSYIDGRCKKMWSDGKLRQYMTWEDLSRLREMGFEVGSHMVNHTDLTALDDTKLAYEFEESRRIISGHIGKDVKVFSYPYGKIDHRVTAIAKKSGYMGGGSSFPGANYVYTDRYILRRTEIDGYDTMNDFRAKLEGWYD